MMKCDQSRVSSLLRRTDENKQHFYTLSTSKHHLGTANPEPWRVPVWGPRVGSQGGVRWQRGSSRRARVVTGGWSSQHLS